MLLSRTSWCSLNCYSHQLHIQRCSYLYLCHQWFPVTYICVIHVFLFDKCFLLPLNPHSNSVCVKHSILCRIMNLHLEGLCVTITDFCFLNRLAQKITPSFHDQSIMATEMRSKTDLKKTTFFHLSPPQQE